MLLCPVNGKETQDKPSNKGLNEHNLVSMDRWNHFPIIMQIAIE